MATARTQSSIAISENSVDWILINASPDILVQIRAFPDLQPARAVRDSGISAVLLMDAQIDHVTGLLMLRERGAPLPLHATTEVFADLDTGLPLMKVLSHYCGVERHVIQPDQGALCIAPLQCTYIHPMTLDSKAPPYSPHRNDPHPGDNIGLLIEDRRTGRSVFYAPGLGAVTAPVLAAMQRADVILVDGTFWTEDEMIVLGLSKKSASEMGHLPQSGPGGMIEVLNAIGGGRDGRPVRKILIHINNSNPILRDDSPERAMLTAHGIEVAYDTMEILL